MQDLNTADTQELVVIHARKAGIKESTSSPWNNNKIQNWIEVNSPIRKDSPFAGMLSSSNTPSNQLSVCSPLKHTPGNSNSYAALASRPTFSTLASRGIGHRSIDTRKRDESKIKEHDPLEGLDVGDESGPSVLMKERLKAPKLLQDLPRLQKKKKVQSVEPYIDLAGRARSKLLALIRRSSSCVSHRSRSRTRIVHNRSRSVDLSNIKKYNTSSAASSFHALTFPYHIHHIYQLPSDIMPNTFHF